MNKKYEGILKAADNIGSAAVLTICIAILRIVMNPGLHSELFWQCFYFCGMFLLRYLGACLVHPVCTLENSVWQYQKTDISPGKVDEISEYSRDKCDIFYHTPCLW